eukprot:CAMPEP_0180347752 /NCGR_PEP_ID=MMETSP0989-20121125/4565_1 /TAXON_ID=697907 /ORGANISM="non described non described, Strain CCMP2293" /LENGTH=53 /DNA_ID=CAMNT_0022336953 /DNA_START=276 /DNA_END=437 /DNA_ORIENTATION=-
MSDLTHRRESGSAPRWKYAPIPTRARSPTEEMEEQREREYAPPVPAALSVVLA